MSMHQHYLVGFFSERRQVEKVFQQIIAQGVSQKFVRIFDKYSILPTAVINSKGLVDKGDIFSNSKISSLATTELGSLLGVRLVADEVSLFIEDPLVAQLGALGWSTNLGVIDANFYTQGDIRLLTELVHDAVLSKQIVLVVETISQKETVNVSHKMQAAVGQLSKVI
jgi:hypothetical protein